VRNYLSYGGGVNSTAMLLLLLDEGWEFEVVFVDHGCDWPETRKYVRWLSRHTPITILIPSYIRKRNGVTFHRLDDYCLFRGIVPSVQMRWCTKEWKVVPMQKYVSSPAFLLLGIDAGESHRAKFAVDGGVERRYPLIEYGIDREGCREIILDHGLPVPPKSGCYFCPYQRPAQWRTLRREHPDLFCKAQQIEEANIRRRIARGKQPYALCPNGVFLDQLIDENQDELFEEFAYPPCHCEL